METYKIINRELTLKNQELNVIAGQLRRDVNFLNSQLLREKEKQQEMIQSTVKILTQSYNEIIKLFHPALEEQKAKILQRDKNISAQENSKDGYSSRIENSNNIISNSKNNFSQQEDKTDDDCESGNEKSSQLSKNSQINMKNITIRSRRTKTLNYEEVKSNELSSSIVRNENENIQVAGDLGSEDNYRKSSNTSTENDENETEEDGDYSNDYGTYCNSRVMSVIPEETSSNLQESGLINQNGDSHSKEFAKALGNKHYRLVLQNSTSKSISNSEESAFFNLTPNHPTSTPYAMSRCTRISDKIIKSKILSESRRTSRKFPSTISSTEESEYNSVKSVKVCLQRLKPHLIAQYNLDNISSDCGNLMDMKEKLFESRNTMDSSKYIKKLPTSSSESKIVECIDESPKYNLRPKRKAAPKCLVEPNLHTKLRRNNQ